DETLLHIVYCESRMLLTKRHYDDWRRFSQSFPTTRPHSALGLRFRSWSSSAMIGEKTAHVGLSVASRFGHSWSQTMRPSRTTPPNQALQRTAASHDCS